MGLKTLLQAKTLDGVLQTTLAGKLDDRAFSAFQRDQLRAAFPGFDYDKCTTSLIETDGAANTMHVESVLLDFDAPDEEVLASYMTVVEHDHLSAIVYANPGRVFLHTDVFDGGAFGYPIFDKHCRKFGIHMDCAVGFNLLAAEEFFIAFDYMGDENCTGWSRINPVELEYASYVFALAWLYRRKSIGRMALERNLQALEGLTLSRLIKLRRFINRKPGEDLSAQAASLGFKLKGYDDPLYDMRDKILTRFGEDVEALKLSGALRLEAIEDYCRLLGIMKDATLPVVVPPGVSLTQAYHARMAGQGR